MAKIDLNLLAYGAGEILTRNELKKIVGGTGSSGDSSYSCKCSITDRRNDTTTKNLTLTSPSNSSCKTGCNDECKRQLLSGGTGCLKWSYSYTTASSGS